MKTYLLVSGDFALQGGMDRANYELAWHLAERGGAAVHLVCHRVEGPLASHPRMTWHCVPKPLNSYLLGAPLLARRGRRVAATLAKQGARVVVNGGNCAWPDVNWVHAVHAAWNNRAAHAPWHFRLRNAWLKASARRAERRAIASARLVLTNSDGAGRQIVQHLGVPAERMRVVYYGVDAAVYRPFSADERSAARLRLGCHPDRPVAVFVGALGRDRNKGMDVLFAAWETLCREPSWNVDLLVAGSGAETSWWRSEAARAGLDKRIRILGHITDMAGILAAADLLVSPTHYDAYGLAVHEALCCDLPAFVTRSAGVAERFPDALADLLLDAPPSEGDLVQRLRAWQRDPEALRARVRPLGATLRQRSWQDMAADIVACIENRS